MSSGFEDELLAPFDLIVVGTDLTNTLIAASAALARKRVLHLDANSFYGHSMVALSLKSLHSTLEAHQAQSFDPLFVSFHSPDSHTTELKLSNSNKQPRITNISFRFPPSPSPSTPSPSTQDQPPSDAPSSAASSATSSPPRVSDQTSSWIHALVGDQAQQSANREVEMFDRKFNIDLISQPLLAGSSFIDVLIKSKVTPYLEFKSIDRAMMLDAATSTFIPVPSSKSDIFTSKHLGLKEKRQLMKFLQLCRAESAEEQSTLAQFADTPFLEFIQQHNQLTANLQSFILYAIVNTCNPATILTKDAVARIVEYIASIGRFPNMKTPFLFPQYGVAEFPQAFSRVSAVSGAIYMLATPTASIHIDAQTNIVDHITTSTGNQLKASLYVFGSGYLGASSERSPFKLYRCICITNKSLITDVDNLLVTIPPDEPLGTPVNALQLGSTMMVVPEGHFLVSFSSTTQPNLLPYVEKILSFDPQQLDDKPFVYYAAFFTVEEPESPEEISQSFPANLSVTPDLALADELGIFDRVTEYTKSLFQRTLGSEIEFMERIEAPLFEPEQNPDEEADLTSSSTEPTNNEHNQDHGEENTTPPSSEATNPEQTLTEQ